MIFNTPVLFLIYARPDLTQQVFEKIRAMQPARLFIAADGPRKDKPGEALLCEQTRKLVLENIDWACEVKTLFRQNNLGCRIAVSEAITWFFEQVEQGIILEDDTLPGESFFIFCEKLLEKYKDDDTIFHISGSNFQFSMIGEGSYYLSKLPHIWGWASWKRAWKNYDVDLKTFNKNEKVDYFQNKEINLFWEQIFANARSGIVDTWDYQWVYALLMKNGFVLQPQYNLVKNIGFDDRSERTSSPKNYLSNLKTYNMDELIHPAKLVYDDSADINFLKHFKWFIPGYENRISGTQALKTLVRISKKRIFKR